MSCSFRRVRLPLIAWAVLLLSVGLASAALAYTPDQADQGGEIYTQRCSTCHGDVGQGLTDEFRATWAQGDQNCWVPHCHGGNPPKPGGFTLPRQVPALVGPGTLAAFANAQQLHAFIRAKMPMQEPGVLSEADYWALAAFLLRANGAPADGQVLDASTAPNVAVPKSGQPLPKPNRTQTVERRMPANNPGSSSDSSPDAAQPVGLTGQQTAMSTSGSPNPAPSSIPTTSGALWTIALAVALALAAAAITLTPRRAPK